ncbi:FtsW/RodA/SpoVE family cell cycle protein [Bacillus carboniphilus]|uniref:FtsW/RodA/SpoVE family cell cycle protein n=1 Tax=Bacillus carboniphilus TaxID=86663 RepID=A0ABY9K082_9BACI|nr:FtsW/RodA/SpoVE family cell cycle protein [Bacillus carboniphilus]WLR43265.1 FtsW/RodA/SpoVE family cell cycle protein [Bacillus carboniphilus]
MDSPKKQPPYRFDYQLAFIVFLLFCISCISIYGAQLTSSQYGATSHLIKQVLYYIVGIGVAITVMFFDSEQLRKMSWYLYGFGILLLIFLAIAPESIARPVNGAKAWFQILGFSFQPAEIMKVFLIIQLSTLIHDHNEKNPNRDLRSDLWLLLKMGMVTTVPILLIVKQPDLGTALVIMAILTGLIFVSGIAWRIILLGTSLIAMFITTIFYLVINKPEILEKYLGIKQYAFYRIYAWLEPEKYQGNAAYHLINSMKAIGSGQIFGKGLGQGQVYIPENHTDFIFAVIGEQFGFIGVSILLSVYFVLIYYLVKVALESNEPFNSYICAGVISLFAFHVFQNAGMTVGLLPITGIPLPLVSYGGSSILGSMLAIGLIFGIRYHYKVYMFSNDDE